LAATSTRSRARGGSRQPDQSFAIHLYCGKGGVGKTTLAAGAARQEAARGRTVLVVSTDPAHSLGDVLGRRLTPVPRRIPTARGRLEAAELEPARTLERWLGPRRPAFERLLLRGTLLDRDDIARLLRLALPGVDELVALLEIERLAAERRPDVVVVDTAPTGHTWRLLDAPNTIAAVAGVLDAMLAHDRALAAAVGGRAPRDAADALVEELANDARRLAARLRDPRAARIVWITLAEPIAVAEAVDGVAWLRKRGLPLAKIIVNRAPDADRRCPTCRARAAIGRASLTPLREAAPGVKISFVRDRPAFAKASARLAEAALEAMPRRRPVAGIVARPLPNASWQMTGGNAIATEGLRLLVVAGKGGVGKTTVAAGLAIEAARQTPGRRVLLLSTDPAHSLGDVLGVRIEDRSRRVRGAGVLEAREIDATATLAREREGLRDAVEEAFSVRAGRGSSTSGTSGVYIDVAHDRDVALRLVDLSPPGVDEILALVSVVTALDRHDLVVVDTAPTGHALKLLAMPELAAAWLSELMRILLKYREVAKIGPLGERIVRLSRSVRSLQALLRNPSQTRVVVVTRAAELPRLETHRLLEALDGLNISTAAVFVNAVTPPRKICSRCRAARAAEEHEIARLARSAATTGVRRGDARRRRRTHGCDIIVAPLALPPPRGVARLARWTRRWTRSPLV
jgi:arsenite/tail-anchored protein-transporting ATPase